MDGIPVANVDITGSTSTIRVSLKHVLPRPTRQFPLEKISQQLCVLVNINVNVCFGRLNTSFGE
jgi:hypothetical protein